MAYEYHFDSTSAGMFRMPRPSYEVLQNAYRALHDELEVWNRRTLEHGATKPPYREEVKDLGQIIAWGNDALARRTNEIVVPGISVGSCRYAKAALMLWIHKRQSDVIAKELQRWPQSALRSLRDEIDRAQSIADRLAYEPIELLWELIPKENRTDPNESAILWDAFISHASEDKEVFVRALAEGLRASGLKIWFDEFSLAVGDSLRRSIDRGLANSRFGIVVISPRFLEKEWPQKELDALVSREVDGKKAILPVWHNLAAEAIRARSPLLADRVATKSDKGLDAVIADLLHAISAGPKAL